MKRANLYIKVPASEMNIQLRKGNPIPSRKAKRSEVPEFYRKSILKTVLNTLLWTFFTLATLNCILFFATVL